MAGVTEGDPRPGFGYGLYAVGTLVEAHGGTVQVASRQGVLVRVSVRLPAVIPLTRRTLAPQSPAARSIW